MENTGPILSGRNVTPRFSMCSNSTNILTVLANFLGIQNLIFSKNIGHNRGNTTSGRPHLQSCHCVQGPFTTLSLCPGPIYNPVIVSRIDSQSCHCVWDPFTILSLCPGLFNNLVIVSRAHSQSCPCVQGSFTILSLCLDSIHNYSEYKKQGQG